MQTVSSGWAGAVSAPFRQLTTAVLLDFNKTTASGVNYFTINTSTIGGRDFIKGGGDTVTFFDKFNYSDYTSKATDWSVSRTIGQYPYGLIMAQADVQFDNTTKLFTPNYDATIGSGILPNRPMKISLGIGNESFSQFVGFTGQPELTVGNRKMAVHAFDAMDYINSYSFTTSGTTFSGTLQNVTTSGIIGYYLTQAGFAPGQFVLDRSLQNNIGYATVLGKKFGDVLSSLAEAEQGLIFADENGIIRFWNRQHFITTSGTGFKFNLNYTNILDLQYQNTPIINDVLVKAMPRTVVPSKRVYTLQSPQAINGNSSTTLFIDFTDEYGPLPVTTITLPVASATVSSSYLANSASDGTGSDMTGFLTIIDSYLFGTSYKITFLNSSSGLVYLTSLDIYGTPAEVAQIVEQRYLDQTSITNYGRNPANNGDILEIDNDFIQDDSSAQSLAYQLVQTFKDPRRHFVVQTFSDPARQIGDYGRLYIPDTDETKNVFITGKKDVLAAGADLQQELTLEERPVVSYFTINSSIIGGTDTIAP